MPLLHGLPSGGGETNVESVGGRQLDSQDCAFNFNPAGGAEHAATPRSPVGRRGNKCRECRWSAVRQLDRFYAEADGWID